MDFTIDGNPVWFYGITGTVQGLQNWSSSKINSSGGGGILTRDGGYIEPVKTTTTVTQHQKFWIVSDKGREYEVNNPKFHCRNGQKVTLIWGASKGKTNGENLLFINYNTNDIISFYGNRNVRESFYALRATLKENLIGCISFIFLITIIGIPLYYITLYISGHMYARRAKPVEERYWEFTKNLIKNEEFMKSIS